MPIRHIDITEESESRRPKQPDSDSDSSDSQGHSRGLWWLLLSITLLVGVAAGWALNCALIGGCL